MSLESAIIPNTQPVLSRTVAHARLKGEDEQKLISLTAKAPFDDRFNPCSTIEDLSPRLITEFLKEINSDLAHPVLNLSPETIGRHMNIVG